MKKLTFIIILLILTVFCGFYFVYQYSIGVADTKNYEDITFRVASGESVKQIAENLLEKDLIKSKFYFSLSLHNCAILSSNQEV